MKNIDFSGKVLKSIPTNIGVCIECKYNGADLSDSDISKTEFIGCDFTKTKFFNTKFILGCGQGSSNKLDRFNSLLFLYWFDYMFDLPDEIKTKINEILGQEKPRIKKLFNSL